MSVTSCTYLPERTSGRGSIKAANSYTTVHRVETDDYDDGPVTVVKQGLHVGPDALPTIYSIFEHGNDRDTTVRLLERQTSPPVKTNTGCVFYVTSTYAEPDDVDEEQSDPNPLNWPPRYWLEGQMDTEPVYYDVDGNRIVNFLELPYPTPIERPRQYPVLCVRKNYGSLAQIFALTQNYVDGVNQRTWNGAAPRTIKVDSFNTSEQLERGGYKYYEGIWRFIYNYQTWDQWKREESDLVTKEIDHTTNTWTLKTACDDDGNPTGEPRLIDPDGFPMDAKSTAYYTRWKVNRLVNLGALGL